MSRTNRVLILSRIMTAFSYRSLLNKFPAIILAILFLAGCGGGAVTIETNPKGGTIIFEGKEYTSPAQLELEEGVHKIEAKVTGYLPAQEEILYKKGQGDRFVISLSKEPVESDSIKPVLVDKAVRIRTSPKSTNSFLYVYDPLTGKIGKELDLETTPIQGDWEKMCRISGVPGDYNHLSGLVVLKNGEAYGAVYLRLNADPAISLSLIEDGWKKPSVKPQQLTGETKQETVTPKNDGSKFTLFSGTKEIASYTGKARFLGKSMGVNIVYTYVDDQGRQKLLLDDGTKTKILWEGEYGLGVFNHIKKQASPVCFLGNGLVAAALATETGYSIAVFDTTSGQAKFFEPLKRFPTNITAIKYSGSVALKMTFSNGLSKTITVLPDGSKLEIPEEIANASFYDSDGTWLDAGNGYIEHRFCEGLSAFIKKFGERYVVVWAGKP
ncbi:MAG TPA: PEGA domain-containing protein [Caldisericia bacterium]|nr:PEGA domain-containing protein [Caldisericia bacterium]HOU07663.1 PEGA domain-containing protein [Caldisericia bacterium]HQG59432.1 PEGA domain-containing protein [Caldisericia bacterium]HQH48983.1 PEGA domain-containing protein [Caldisericia bacterium]HQJ43790.1 PEGA domain-containing protein [Caldisericia bacterium]